MKTSLEQTVFLHSPPRSGILFDFRSQQHSTLVAGWQNSQLELTSGSSHFGFVSTGRVRLCCESGSFELNSGMYFVIPGVARIEGGGTGVVMSMAATRGLFQIGGPVEETGRLRYIDGCSDTLLIAPPMLGDPCLNLLHIPPGTHQTEHTHPSLRVGIVVDGAGVCRTPDGETPLTPGLVFAIRTDGRHSFHTEDTALRIVAWHPDSDFGPTHAQHPMLNRTLVNGQPVNAAGDAS